LIYLFELTIALFLSKYSRSELYLTVLYLDEL
jgi:hypothetical protein